MTTQYEWPCEGQPGNKDWVEWRMAINSVYFVGIPTLLLPLSYQLRKWDDQINNTSWKWWYDVNDDMIYHQVTDTLAWTYNTDHDRRRHMNREHNRRDIKNYDTTRLKPCTVNPHLTGNRVTFTGLCRQGRRRDVQPTDFLTFLRSECTHDRWVYQNITMVGEMSQLTSALRNGELRAVCDGSYDIGYGTSGWFIDGSSAIMRGVNIVPIGSDSLDATRCELAGIYTVLRILECFAIFHNITSGKVEIGCDYEGGLKRTLLREKYIKYNYTNSSYLDLINPINKINSTAQFQIVGRHVKGHQDKNCVYEHLDWWGQRNVDMDLIAKYLMFSRRKDGIKNKGYGISVHEIVGVVINGIKITGGYINAIHDIIQGKKLLDYWNDRGRFPASQNKLIDWDIVKLARNILPFDRKIWMTKQVSSFCGTGTKMKLWQFRESDVCPLCPEQEDNYHVIRRKSVEAGMKWDEAIDSLEATLTDNYTPQETVEMIIGQLNNWRSTTHTPLTCHTPSLQKAVLAQEIIGWQAFMEGCLSITWRIHASTFSQRKYSPRRWTALLVKKLWLVAFDMWDHRCKLLHTNDLSNKIQDLPDIDRRIRSVLRKDTLALCPHERRVFYILEAEIFAKTQYFCRK